MTWHPVCDVVRGDGDAGALLNPSDTKRYETALHFVILELARFVRERFALLYC